MTRAPVLLMSFGLVFAACGGPAAPTTQPTQPPGQTAAATTPPVGATATPAQGTPQSTPPPQGGIPTVNAQVIGGPDAGMYQGSADPNCSFGFIGPGIWGVSYGDEATAQGVTGIVVTAQPGETAGTFGFQSSTIFDNARTYTVTNLAGSTDATISVLDGGAGAGASLHIKGPTIDGTAQVELVINCPSVTRP
jgi:hypothetical protein